MFAPDPEPEMDYEVYERTCHMCDRLFDDVPTLDGHWESCPVRKIMEDPLMAYMLNKINKQAEIIAKHTRELAVLVQGQVINNNNTTTTNNITNNIVQVFSEDPEQGLRKSFQILLGMPKMTTETLTDGNDPNAADAAGDEPNAADADGAGAAV
jgi:hypothetical protein